MGQIKFRRQTLTGCCSCSNQDLGQSIRSAAFRRSTAFRKLKPDNAVGLPEIHGFCNGGEKAYGAVVFLRWKLANGNYFCVPLMVKAFVASLKEKYLPLELAELYVIYFILFLFYLTSPCLTNMGQGFHNSITNYCGPKNKY